MSVDIKASLCGRGRIHLMAGRIPAGASRSAVSREMEEVFVQNLRYAAEILSKVSDVIQSRRFHANILLSFSQRSPSSSNVCSVVQLHINLHNHVCTNKKIYLIQPKEK